MKESYLRAVYAAWSRVYDSIIDRIFAFDRQRVISALYLKRGERVLEVGVGTGLNLNYYPRDVFVTGIDFSKAMLLEAQKKKVRAKITLLLCNAAHTPFADSSFDKTLATYVLRVAPNPKGILVELARVTRKGATFVLLDQFSEQKSFLMTLLEPIQILLGWGRNYSLTELIRGTAWRIESSERFGKMQGTTLAVLRNKKAQK